MVLLLFGRGNGGSGVGISGSECDSVRGGVVCDSQSFASVGSVGYAGFPLVQMLQMIEFFRQDRCCYW